MNDDQSRNRFMIISLVRLGGAVMTAIGLIVVAGKIDLPAYFGYALVLLGVFEFAYLPKLLAKKWRSPTE